MKKIYSISVDKELMDQADEMAEKQFLGSRSWFIVLAIKHYIRYLKKQDG